MVECFWIAKDVVSVGKDHAKAGIGSVMGRFRKKSAAAVTTVPATIAIP